MPTPAGAPRCLVHVRVGTAPIRALFDHDRPPVATDEWDEHGYVEARLRAYAEALEGLALLRPMSSDDEETFPDRDDAMRCPRTGDLVRIDLPAIDDTAPGAPGHEVAAREVRHDQIAHALRRVFADAHAWRRHLKAAYFERHRAWRAVVGAPIQH